MNSKALHPGGCLFLRLSCSHCCSASAPPCPCVAGTSFRAPLSSVAEWLGKR